MKVGIISVTITSLLASSVLQYKSYLLTPQLEANLDTKSPDMCPPMDHPHFLGAPYPKPHILVTLSQFPTWAEMPC